MLREDDLPPNARFLGVRGFLSPLPSPLVGVQVLLRRSVVRTAFSDVELCVAVIDQARER